MSVPTYGGPDDDDLDPAPVGTPDLDHLWRVWAAYRVAAEHVGLAPDLKARWRISLGDNAILRRLTPRLGGPATMLFDVTNLRWTLFGEPVEITPKATYPELVIVCDRRR